jgi:hypothetical protein
MNYLRKMIARTISPIPPSTSNPEQPIWTTVKTIPPEAPYVFEMVALRRRVRTAAAIPAVPSRKARSPSPNPPAACPNTGLQYAPR